MSKPLQEVSTIVRSAICRTKVAHRPYPSLFYYPGLTSKPFWKADQFPYLRNLLSKKHVLLQEYRHISKQRSSDYVSKTDEHTLHQGKWEWHSAVQKGVLQPSFQLLCPETASLLQSIPDLLTDGVPFAYTFFSDMSPQAKIAPHFGPCNIRLRVHVPLDVPSEDASKCGIRVGGETRGWTSNEPLVFDDTYEHETWNHTDKSRVILLMDLWHPELSQAEREGIRNMFAQARANGWLT